MARVAILGLGLIGGSLGLALRGSVGKGQEVVGYDRDRETARKAQERGAVERAAPSLREAVAEAGLVVIATGAPGACAC